MVGTDRKFPWLAVYPQDIRTSLEYPKQPLTAFLDRAAQQFPNQTALAFLGRKMTYRALREASDSMACGLAALGVSKGDRVAVLLPNCPQFVISCFAILRLGAVVVPINHLSVERELAENLRSLSCRAIICQDARFDRLSAVRGSLGIEICVVTGLDEYMPALTAFFYRRRLRRLGREPGVISGCTRFADVLAAGGTPPAVEIDAERDLAALQLTGGTTGTAKAAMLTHYNLAVNALQLKEWFVGGREGRETLLGVLPLSHIFGLTVVMNLGVLLGGTIVLLPRFEPSEALEAIQNYRVTLFPGVPAMFDAVASYPLFEQYSVDSLRICVSGAAALSPDLAASFETTTGVPLLEGYGLTEASPVTHCNLGQGPRKRGSVGVPLPDTECKIVDLESGEREMPAGVAGELIIRGPQVMSGYWDRPEETAATLRGGWLYTGDIARLDGEGFTYIVDRKKDIIIDGGYNIYPDEIEKVLLELPQVVDVAVVGLPDKMRGEKIKAYIVLAKDASLTGEEILAHCRQRLAAYKVPRMLQFRRDLPKTITGKTLRRMLVEEEKNRP
jgi:long-chain acyl-CoA synthetase